MSYGGCGCYGAVVAPAPVVEPAPEKKPETVAPPKEAAPAETGGKEVSTSKPALIVVSLPAEAKLTFNGHVTQLTSSTRTFSSPPLERGQSYFYTLNAEVTRDGKVLSVSKRVTLRAGEEAHVSVEFPETRVAQK
ncbi:MAG: TIGR03000 domain-containing protein [Planctomycetes bacterium]|nr:TIGR03000 domain-containing protein [Planctomycetota bacterium]